MKRIVALGDIHIPAHDSNVVNRCFQQIKRIKPDVIVLLGDILDCYPLSRFLKDPERTNDFQEELASTRKLIQQLRRIVPSASMYYLEGNHEQRLQKYLWNTAPQLASLKLSIPSLLELKDLGIQYITDQAGITTYGVRFCHGFMVRQNAGQTGLAHLLRFQQSCVVGHSHRLGIVYRTSLDKTQFACEAGCLVNPAQCEYAVCADWAHGYIMLEQFGNRMIPQAIPL